MGEVKTERGSWVTLKSAPQSPPAHHTDGVNGVPLSNSPHAQGQDSEVGPDIGAREHHAAPVGRGTQVKSQGDRP